MSGALGPITTDFAVKTLGKMHGMGGHKAWVSGRSDPEGPRLHKGRGGKGWCSGVVWSDRTVCAAMACGDGCVMS